ncbi:hypothetical protein VP01_830g5 [Puccinia sorghi]|uniref:Uncharacterized protein n=1 Tax=Puccinia sorghi TaxID=27349 RepID=A0A0L6U9P1_9BASI|nr:hypothetical protein VP01_830g5 [Puccinia sorghi]
MRSMLYSICSHPSVSFTLLVLHQSAISLVKQSRTTTTTGGSQEDLYNPATAIFLTEALKALISLSIFLLQSPIPIPSLLPQLFLQPFTSHRHPLYHLLDMSLPAILYTYVWLTRQYKTERVFRLQNHLLYISLTELDTAIFLITSQIKILTTALSSVLISQRVLVRQQWVSLCMLVLGVTMVQFEPTTAESKDRRALSTLMVFKPNQLKGLVALLLSCMASGLAGAWFERSLKPIPSTSSSSLSSDPADAEQEPNKVAKGKAVSHAFPEDPRRQPSSLWAKNLQLAVPSLAISYTMIYLEPHSRRHTLSRGFFYGFLPSSSLAPSFSSTPLGLVWLIILYHSLGGLLVSIIVKQSGSLVKNFATCFSILLSVLASSYPNQTKLGFNFYLGCLLVLVSIKTFTCYSSSHHK